ncbi:MAG: TIM barrel protein [Thermoplasmata archaeon]|nr:TIM barrel protein [Thermoplasmata archaeon]MCI4341770.1 TIM barrel protein [Thermoplasmata archaeon]
MIRFGPAGIPLSCKGRTLRDGIADVHHLGLTALEVQFIKVNPLVRMVLDEEVGQLPKDLPLQLIVEVASGKSGELSEAGALEHPLKRRGNLTALTWSLAKDAADLALTRALAKSLDVDLTLHAPYYVDFFGSEESRDRSIRQIQWSGVLASGLGARLAVTHLGFYGTGDREASVAELTGIARDLTRWLERTTKGSVRLGIEPSGHPDVFGSREEVLELARTVKGIVPVLNLPHLAARERRTFDEPGALEPLLTEFVDASGGALYLNFSGADLYGTGEFRLTPIKRGELRFDPLAEALSDRDYDVTVISSSPLLEHDAMYMKLLYERALTRRWAKRHQAASRPPTAVAPAPPARRSGSLPASGARSRLAPPKPRARPAPRRRSHGSRSSR